MQLLILLDNTRRETLTEQLVEQIHEAIRKGRIARGARLPSSRNLADQLGISRNTVVRAYENLILEGHIEARPASGMFVAEEPPPLAAAASIASVAPSRPSVTQPVAPVDLELKRFVGVKERRMMVDFALDQTSAAMFPLKMWRRLTQDHLSQGAASSLSIASDPAGLSELRAAIAHYQSAARGFMVDPAQIIITSGRIESFNLIARMFLTYDARVVMEDPGYLGACLSFKSAGARIMRLPGRPERADRRAIARTPLRAPACDAIASISDRSCAISRPKARPDRLGAAQRLPDRRGRLWRRIS